jgi:ABC-type sugar transport system ATPase subunit
MAFDPAGGPPADVVPQSQTQPQTATTLLEMRGIRKSFAAGEVLHGIDFKLERGQIHALVGQNGAGKSTLMKVLGGVYPDYSGVVYIEGRAVRLDQPRTAFEQGIAVLYQDFALVPAFSVAENIALGREPKAGLPGVVSHRALRERSAAEARAMGIDLPMDEEVRRLGVAEQQLTEVVRALSRHARILVMDEPTARLSPAERDNLFETMRRLKAAGVGIVYISHFLEEVFLVADRVTVLRDGYVVAERPTEELDLRTLAALMVGTALSETERASRSAARPGTPALELEGLSVAGRPPVSLAVQPGEILGLAGLVGSGRTRLARAIVGDGRPTGTIRVNGRPRQFRTPADAARAGVLLLPEDRKRDGLVLPSPVGNNLALSALDSELSRLGFVRRVARQRLIANLIERFRIVPPDPDRQVRTLSGGNQQKVLMGRAFGAKAAVLILDQPTAGVDVGVKAEIYEQVRLMARDGTAFILISDDLDELLLLCDRIVVMRRGWASEPVLATSFSRAELLEAITRSGTEVAA